MPKFYVESGTLQLVTTAANGRSAAIWAVHRTLSQSLPFLCDEPGVYLELRPLTRLAESVRVSECGFGQSAAEQFDTLDVVTEWNQLLVAVDRLHQRLSEAAAARP
jgi:hypothetical protein